MDEVKICDTTMTPRVARHWCVCVVRTDELGPCRHWEQGANGRCVYCDHEEYCHVMLEAAAAGAA
jgi:hypothetical protein